jgi:hypothetical protein
MWFCSEKAGNGHRGTGNEKVASYRGAHALVSTTQANTASSRYRRADEDRGVLEAIFPVPRCPFPAFP